MPASHSTSKSLFRQQARVLRDSLPPSGAAGLANAIALYLAGQIPPVVGGYVPIGSEIDPTQALRDLRRAGARIALPETTAPGTPLIFRLWTEGETLLAGRYGTSHPSGPEIIPDLLLVPLLAFDRRCHRLGYGGGYYDRTLAAHPHLRAIGCAHAAQELDEIPAGPYDISLHAIATERGVIEAPPPA